MDTVSVSEKKPAHELLVEHIEVLAERVRKLEPRIKDLKEGDPRYNDTVQSYFMWRVQIEALYSIIHQLQMKVEHMREVASRLEKIQDTRLTSNAFRIDFLVNTLRREAAALEAEATTKTAGTADGITG